MKKIKSKYNNTKQSRGFTFIELVISISILTVLSVLGFISYSKNLEDTRDSQRESDLSYMTNALKLHKTKRSDYPIPSNSFNIVNSGALAAIQGKINNQVVISTMDKIPLDPFTKQAYSYSISKNKEEFQIAVTLENNGANKAMLKGDYKVVTKNILPTIILALSGAGNVEINESVGSGSENRKTFVFDNSMHNLPYSFEEPYYPYSDYLAFTGFLSDPSINWKQNNNYKNCNDIYTAGKNIGTGEYQVNNYGNLKNVNCDSTYTYKNCKEIKESLPSSTDGNYMIMPDGIVNKLNVYCDMTTGTGGWTLMAKDGITKNYRIGHCNFNNPSTITDREAEFIYWACDLGQTEMLFKTPTGWIIGTSSDDDDCGIMATKTNNNTCTLAGNPKTFEITNSGGCFTSYTGSLTPPTNRNLWWKGSDWETGVTKNLSGLSTQLIGTCNSLNTSYCNIFDIYDDATGNGIGLQYGEYRKPNCGSGSTGSSGESHLIFVR